MSEAKRTVEREITFDVAADTPLPNWTLLAEVVRVSDAEVRDLDAQYFDTADLDLAHAGVAVRRRTGGPDAGWHIKGPLEDGARTELQWPLVGEDSGGVPRAVREAVSQLSTAPLTPLARIVNERHAFQLIDARGDAVAEFVDDHVRAWDIRAGEERSWREWEVELGPAAPENADDREAFFANVTTLAYEAGAKPASSASKLARTLGH